MTLPPLPARWYCVSRDGLATLCASEQNAIEMASDCARDYPRQAPYRAVLMCDVAAELATDAQRYRKLRNANMDVRNRLEHYGGDALDERLDALNSLALGPNVGGNRLAPTQEQR